MAEKIVLVTDNLNTHTCASLYKAFPPEEARRLAERFEWHFTPKHGSWLDMAEIELGVMCRQALAKLLPDAPSFIHQVRSWTFAQNQSCSMVNWQFSTKDARIKLSRRYPTIAEFKIADSGIAGRDGLGPPLFPGPALEGTARWVVAPYTT